MPGEAIPVEDLPVIPSSSKLEVVIATGRRKTATARVRLKPSGSGHYVVNGRLLQNYCSSQNELKIASLPLKIVEAEDQFDAVILVNGSGPTSQAGAIAHGLARALEKYNPDWRLPLKRRGCLKRDPRQKERKKAGQPGARKRFQFSKR